MQRRTVASPDAPPTRGYAAAVEVSGASRLLFVSGQIPALPDGTVPEGFEAQCRACWRNVLAQLAAAGMGPENIVRIGTFLADASFTPAARAVRAEMLGGREVAATTVVAGLIDPAWLVEIEAVAAA
ncbi:MAG: RidA family protein [Acetobacteraceae bacterium]|nr:RidA family protein [Acetobacteraceae bacterium]